MNPPLTSRARLLLPLVVCSFSWTLFGCQPRITSLGEWLSDAGQEPLGPEAGPDVSKAQYLEAESGALSGGFTVGDDPRASDLRFLEPPVDVTSDDVPGEARARYEFSVSAPGGYVIWGRIRSPGALVNRFWFQVDGGQWFKWRISVGDIWYWDSFHDDAQYRTPLTFELATGAHELVIANCVAGAALDRLYFTTGNETPPGNDTPCDPPNSIELAGVCQPSCGSQGGDQCGDQACQGHPLLTAYDCGVCCHVAP